MFSCPWDDQNFLNEMNVIVGQVLSIITVILASALINCLLYLLSKGWSITEFSMGRNEVTNVVTIFGIVYIVMLAQQYSEDDSSNIQFLFAFVLCMLYGSLLIVTTKNINRQVH
mmetsp:Transcript_42349/g.64979  ORF Transcript_42349/g.64979 Transcript_42349/m.64979 type:complete len:114 (+) Transcript_42349:1046-1387(+)